jgi:2-keto-3-deoxy-L-rhamnonate aldolase RhmA
MSPFKKRLRDNAPCIGAWLTVPSVKTADAMASCGFHWLAADLEHAAIPLDVLEACFIAAERHGVVPMARIPAFDAVLARRLLDIGAEGLIVAASEDVEVFAAFAHATRYPPAGRRGAGLSRCNAYGDRFDDYFRLFEPILVAQVETRRGIEAAEALARLPEVDAIFLGPYDLSADLGAAGDFTTAAFAEALAEVKAACARHGKPIGIHQVAPDKDELLRRQREGYNFIAFSTDIIAMRTALGRPADLFSDRAPSSGPTA